MTWATFDVWGDDEANGPEQVHVIPTYEDHDVSDYCWCEPRGDEGVAAERARILALLDEPRAYRLALAEYAARREQGHDRFEAMRLAVAAVRALVGGDDCARSLPRDTPTPEDTHEWRERDS